MTTTETTIEIIESALAKANGNRRVRTVEIGSVLWMVRKLLTKGAVTPIAYEVANSYGYASTGTYVAAHRKTTGEVVLGIWEDSTNRVGKLPGVTARRPDRIQGQIDEMVPMVLTTGEVWVIDLENALRIVARDETEAAILRELADSPGDVVTTSAWKDYCQENGFDY